MIKNASEESHPNHAIIIPVLLINNWDSGLGGAGTYSEDPETGAIECDTVHC